MLIGRSRELARLTARVRDLAGGRGGAAFVDGEPGIGKTTLVRAACEVAVENGCRVHWGAGDELGELLPCLVGARPSDELLRHAEGAAGNPLYATELVSAVADGAARPGSLAAAIDHRLDFLAEQTRHVLRAATLLGVVFSVAD